MLAPTASSSPEELADWLELRALHSADQNSSIQDLVRELRRSGTTDALVDESEDDDEGYESDPGSQKSQNVAEDAFAEVEARRGACATVAGSSFYPFEIDSGSLALGKATEGTAYLFLLLLTVYGKDAGPARINGEDLFEDVCAEALKSYFGGAPQAKAVVFGFPRRVLPAGFNDAVNQLCRDLGEGGSCRSRPTRKHQKDAKLDIVAWREFPDQRHGKLIGFGQCATGANWTDKLTELLPQNFCQKWFVDAPVVAPVRTFFVPLRIERMRWPDTCIDAGIVFDRCRIAGCLENPSDELVRRCTKWVQHVLTHSSAKPRDTRSRRRGVRRKAKGRV